MEDTMSRPTTTPTTSNGRPIACEACELLAATSTVLDANGNERDLCDDCASTPVAALDLREGPSVLCDCPRCEALTAASLRGAA
jgi:hypothetical protein